MKHRFLSFIISFILSVVSMYAATSGSCGTGVTWTLDDNGVLTISGSGAQTTMPWNAANVREIVIGSGVTSIASNAFSTYNVESVTIADGTGTLTVDKGAFLGLIAKKLYIGRQMSITRASSKTASAFGAINVDVLEFGSSVTAIDKYWFYGFDKTSTIKSVTMSNSVKSIGQDSFRGCYIYSLYIGTGVTSVDEYSFDQDAIVKAIWLPNTAPTNYEKITAKHHYVANDSYSGITDMNKTVNPYISSTFVTEGIKYAYNMSDKTCYVIDCSYLEEDKTINIGAEVTYKSRTFTVLDILPYACYGNPYITSVKAENNGNVGASAFYNCSANTSVVLGNSGNVGASAFYGNTALTNIDVHNDGYLGASAFEGAGNFASVNIRIPSYIGLWCFSDSKLRNVNIESATYVSSSSFWGARINGQVVVNCSGNIGQSAFARTTGNYTINVNSASGVIGVSAFESSTGVRAFETNSNTTALPENCFKYCSNLTTVTLPQTSIDNFGLSCFEGCSSLAEFAMPHSVIQIGVRCFADCSAMQHCLLSNTLTAVPKETFLGCSSLQEIQFPVSVASIGRSAFCGCRSIAEVRFDETETPITIDYDAHGTSSDRLQMFHHPTNYVLYLGRPYEMVNGISLSNASGKYLPFTATNVSKLYVSATCSSIKNTDFMNCAVLNEIQFAEGVKDIGTQSFQGCVSLPKVALPNSITAMGARAFEACTKLKEVTLGGGSYTLNAYTFRNCTSLPMISIPQGITSISDAFNGCTALKNFYVEDRSTVLSFTGNGSTTKDVPDDVPMFRTCPLDSIYLGGNITYPTSKDRGFSPFYFHPTLRAAKLGGKTTQVYGYMFYQCRALKNVVTSNSVTAINARAFSGCMGMETIYLSKGLRTVGEEAFSDCNPDDVYAYAEVPATCGVNAFRDITPDSRLHVPAGTTSAYELADGWENFWDIYEDATEMPQEPEAYWIAVDANGEKDIKELTMTVGETITVKVRTNIPNATSFRVKIVDTSIATYSTGKIINAVSEGTTVMRITIQDMTTDIIINVVGVPEPEPEGPEYTCPEPGLLSTVIKNTDCTELKIVGDINGTDIKFLRDLIINHSLVSLDLSEANIVAGGEAYYQSNVTVNQQVGTRMFDSCKKLQHLVLPANTTYIGNYAFRECDALTELEIPASVTSLGYGLLLYVDNLPSLTVEEGNTQYVATDNVLFNLPKSSVVACATSKTGTVELPESVEVIANRAFVSCDKLDRIVIPGEVISVGTSAFSGTASQTHPMTIVCKQATKELILADSYESLSYIEWEIISEETPEPDPIAPTEEGYWPVATDGETEQYIYNIETKSFMLGANDWDTRASVSRSNGYKFKVLANGDGTYTLSNFCHTFNSSNWDWRGMFAENESSIWVDNSNGANANSWVITPVEGETNVYEISNPAAATGKLSVKSDMSDTRLFFTSESGYSTRWAFISGKTFNTMLNTDALAAKWDLITQTNVYDREGYDAYVSAYNNAKELLESGELTEDVFFVNPTVPTGHKASTEYEFLLTPWTFNEEACTAFEQALYVNTWSKEGDTDATGFQVPFLEYFANDWETLNGATLEATVDGLLPNSPYEVTAWTRVRCTTNEELAGAPHGIQFSVGQGTPVDACNGEYVAGTAFYLTTVSATGNTDENGVLHIRYSVADDTNVHWLSFKNVFYTATARTEGDVNGNGNISLPDIPFFVRQLLLHGNDLPLEIYDINHDGSVDLRDMEAIRDMLLAK